MDHLRITVEGKTYDVVVETVGSTGNTPAPAPVKVPVQAARAAAPTPAPAPVAKPAAAGAGDAVSPLAGIVQSISASVGSSVNEGDLVLTLEAMKMYTPINALTSGTIKAIHVQAGDAVEEGQVLYTIG